MAGDKFERAFVIDVRRPAGWLAGWLSGAHLREAKSALLAPIRCASLPAAGLAKGRPVARAARLAWPGWRAPARSIFQVRPKRP